MRRRKLGSPGAAAAPWRLAVVIPLVLLVAAAGGEAQGRAAHHQAAPTEPRNVPPYADIVVDGNSGAVLHESNPDEPRHPASLTKIMTLYLLFEQLELGALKLDTALPVSPRAAQQHPTKLGLKANTTVTVEDAIGGIVTRSANDAAVVVSEAVGGSEEAFAKLMTAKAHELGMISTTYVNASGLPADEQITTARDQATLGRAIRERFPNYFPVFSTLSYRYHGVDIHNHNGLLGRVEGVDGIKTGYTDASGYNLVSSVHRDDKSIVAVVLGETSNSAREARMRGLIEEGMRQASAQRTGPTILQAARGEPTRGEGAKTAAPAAGPIGFEPASASSRPVRDNFEE
jgi:D-alanyl-D-alanine carboxypeptidase